MQKFINEHTKHIVLFSTIIFLIFNIIAITVNIKFFAEQFLVALIFFMVVPILIILVIKLNTVIGVNKKGLNIFNYAILLILIVAQIGYSVSYFIFIGQININIIYGYFGGILGCMYIIKKSIIS